MADPGQAKLNEFYLLHTSPTSTFRRVKDVQIQVVDVFEEQGTVKCADILDSRATLLLLDTDEKPVLKTLDLESEDVEDEKFKKLKCPKCKNAKTKFHSNDLMMKGQVIVVAGECKTCGYLSGVFKLDGSVAGLLSHGPPDYHAVQFDGKTHFVYIVGPSTVAMYSWRDVQAGQYSARLVEIDKIEHDFFGSMVLVGDKLAIVWQHGYLKLPAMSKSKELPKGVVEDWNAIGQVSNDRFAIAGKRYEEDSHKQIIQLYSGYGKLLHTLKFDFFAEDELWQVEQLTMVNRHVMLARGWYDVIHVLQVARNRLTVIRTNIETFEPDGELIQEFAIRVNKKTAIVAAAGKIAIVRLVLR